MIRYALRVQYIGKNYAGSQLQLENGRPVKGLPTIQGELEKALGTLIKNSESWCEVRKDLPKGKDLKDETLRNRRCERSESGVNEQILDLTGGNRLNVVH